MTTKKLIILLALAAFTLGLSAALLVTKRDQPGNADVNQAGTQVHDVPPNNESGNDGTKVDGYSAKLPKPTAHDELTTRVPRTIRVATWNPVDVEAPDWIHPAIVKVQNNRRRFGWYDGDYEQYTADLIAEIQRVHPDGGPVTLVLQHWLGARHVGGGRQENIDPFGLFTHKDDRLTSGLPGIWPNAGMEFWRRANDHLMRELVAAGIEVDFFALDTEIWPHRHNPPWRFDGVFQQIVTDPRWHTEPLIGLGGLTGADIWPEPPLDDAQQLNWLIRRIGTHSFAVAKNEVLKARALSYFPSALVSDYNDYAQWLRLDDQDSESRRVVLETMAKRLGHPWFRAGMGNAASPSLYGGSKWTNATMYGHVPGESVLETMLRYAEQTIELHGCPSRFAPWITTRARMDSAAEHEEITEEKYRQWIKALVDLGIKRFIWWPCGDGDPLDEQALTVSAFEQAAAARASRCGEAPN